MTKTVNWTSMSKLEYFAKLTSASIKGATGEWSYDCKTYTYSLDGTPLE